MKLWGRKERAHAWWWVRFIFQGLLALITCALLAISLARILNIDVTNWPALAAWLVLNLGQLAWEAGAFLVRLITSIPPIIFDLISAYLLIGGLMRLSVRNIALLSEKSFLNRSLDFWDDASHRDGIATARREGAREARRHYLLWPERFISDARGGYWSLAPLRMLIFLAIVLAFLVWWHFLAG